MPQWSSAVTNFHHELPRNRPAPHAGRFYAPIINLIQRQAGNVKRLSSRDGNGSDCFGTGHAKQFLSAIFDYQRFTGTLAADPRPIDENFTDAFRHGNMQPSVNTASSKARFPGVIPCSLTEQCLAAKPKWPREAC